FRLESYNIRSLNLMHIGPPGRAGPENGFPGATNTTWYAQSYTISAAAPLLLVQPNVEKYCRPGAVTGTLVPCSPGQHPGDLVIQIRANNPSGNFPGSAVLQSETIPEADIPWGRVWVNATGWNLNLTADSTYWVVLSTVNGTAGGYYPWKEESAYQHQILRSSDAGATWGRPREPADMLIDLRTGAQSFSVEPEVEITAKIGGASWVSQSIEVGRPTAVSTVLVFVSREVADNEGTITVDIRADDGYGHPSQMALATGTLTPSEGTVTWKGIWAVNLNYPITLQPGETYWLVFRSVDTQSGKNQYPEMALQAFAFHNDSASYGGSRLGAFESANSGQSWARIGGLHTDLIFGLAYSPLAAAKPTVGQLVGEVESRQLLSTANGQLTSAWQSFLASSTSKIQTDVVEWLNRQNITAYLAPGNTTAAAPQRTWVSFDTNPPSLFEHSTPGPSDFDLYPVVSLNSRAQSIVPTGEPSSTIPVVAFASRGGLGGTSAAEYFTLVSSLNRSVVFVNANPVELFGRLDSLSGAFSLLSRMRSVGLSWPAPYNASSAGSAPGPWLTQTLHTEGIGSGGGSGPQSSSLALLDIGSMQLVWKGNGFTYASNRSASQVAYVIRTKGDLGLDYSNVLASSEAVYPNQALYTFVAPRGQEVWALVNSTRSVQSVTVNGAPVPETANLTSLVAAPYAAQGWLLQQDGVLLARFPSSGENVVRIVLVSQPPPDRVVQTLEAAAPILVIVVAAAIDFTVWVVYVRRRPRRAEPDSPNSPSQSRSPSRRASRPGGRAGQGLLRSESDSGHQASRSDAESHADES
ncbi:MAG TPA: choice-of-anchor R domain-containing protein, partial [Nitrososphaerales archaeon]|nr:choice-of-anchor R domain-containing protein [Nitrososphaerales archaeon]